MPRVKEPKIRLEPLGELVQGREWVLSGVIPGGSPSILIERGYEFSGIADEGPLPEIAAPFDEWLAWQSTYVHQSGWWPTHDGDGQSSGSLFVEFLTLCLCRYDNIPLGLWLEYVQSPSHGQKQHYVIDKIEYAMLTPPLRKVDEAMKQRNYTRTSTARTE